MKGADLVEEQPRKRGRPKKPKVKIKDLLTYIEQLPPDNSIKKSLTPDKMVRIKRTVEELNYLELVISNLKLDIEEVGEIELYVNGKQKTRRANPALTTYLDVIKTYNQLLKQVSEILRNIEIDEWKEFN